MTVRKERTKKDGNKVKLLHIMETLRNDSSEEKPLTMEDITAKLGAHGILCERRTFGKDMRLLMDSFNVKCRKVGRKNGYYVSSRALNDTEIKILIDTVQAASFLSPAATEFFVRKLSRIGGRELAKRVKENYVLFNVRKRKNQEIFDTVEAIKDALTGKKMISFVYNDLNFKGERVPRKEGERYEASPLTLVVHDDRYYVLCPGRDKGFIKFRLDRMTEVVVEKNKNVPPGDLEKREYIPRYLSEVFDMYTGETKRISLAFEKELAEMIYDQFGEDLDIKELDEKTAQAVVDVSVSDTFFSWLATFGGRIRIAGSKKVEELYRAFLERNLEACRKS